MAYQNSRESADDDDADERRNAPVGSNSNTGRSGPPPSTAGDGKDHYGLRTRGRPNDDLSGATTYGGLRTSDEPASATTKPYSDWKPTGDNLDGSYGEHDDAVDLYGRVGAGVRSAPPGDQASAKPRRGQGNGQGSGSTGDSSSAQGADSASTRRRKRP